ncbi:hypothetical protein IAR50_007311 [Cryptococcus sp. DSM 104548]
MSASSTEEFKSYPPESLTSNPSSALGQSGHTCFSAKHLKPADTFLPSSPSADPWSRLRTGKSFQGGSKIATWEFVSKVHFNNGTSTIIEQPCMGESIRCGLDVIEPNLDDFVVGNVPKHRLSDMGLWPTYRDVYKSATGVELGVFDDAGHFVNVFSDDPVFSVEPGMTGDAFDGGYKDFLLRSQWKTHVKETIIERTAEKDSGIVSIEGEEE